MANIKQFKVVVVGNEQEGKSSFVKHHMGIEFSNKYVATLGVEVHPLIFDTSSGHIQFNIWDCAGNPKLSSLEEGYYINANAALLFLDIGGRHNHYQQEIRRTCGDIPILEIRNWKEGVDGDSGSGVIDLCVKNGVNCDEPLLLLSRLLMNDNSITFM